MSALLFRIITGIAAVYHLLLGLAGLLLPIETFARFSSVFLGVSPSIDAQFHLITKFSAAYILAFGIMLLLLALNPVKNRVLVIPVLALFGVRLLNKIVFFDTIGSSFDVEPVRNIISVVTVLFFFTAILLTRPREKA